MGIEIDRRRGHGRPKKIRLVKVRKPIRYLDSWKTASAWLPSSTEGHTMEAASGGDCGLSMASYWIVPSFTGRTKNLIWLGFRPRYFVLPRSLLGWTGNGWNSWPGWRLSIAIHWSMAVNELYWFWMVFLKNWIGKLRKVIPYLDAEKLRRRDDYLSLEKDDSSSGSVQRLKATPDDESDFPFSPF